MMHLHGVDEWEGHGTMSQTKLNRRSFLLAVGAGGAATAAAIAAKAVNPAATQTPTGDGKRRGKGYQETAHVRSYYNTAKV
jgi:hypothetical protein